MMPVTNGFIGLLLTIGVILGVGLVSALWVLNEYVFTHIHFYWQ